MNIHEAKQRIMHLLAPNIQHCAYWNLEVFEKWAMRIIKNGRPFGGIPAVERREIRKVLKEFKAQSLFTN